MVNYTVLAICLMNDKLIDNTLRQLSSLNFDHSAKGFEALETAVEVLLSSRTYSGIAAFVFRRMQKAKNPEFKPAMPVQRKKYIVEEASKSARRRARGGEVDSTSLRRIIGHKIMKRKIATQSNSSNCKNCESSKCVLCSAN